MSVLSRVCTATCLVLPRLLELMFLLYRIHISKKREGYGRLSVRAHMGDEDARVNLFSADDEGKYLTSLSYW